MTLFKTKIFYLYTTALSVQMNKMFIEIKQPLLRICCAIMFKKKYIFFTI